MSFNSLKINANNEDELTKSQKEIKDLKDQNERLIKEIISKQ